MGKPNKTWIKQHHKERYYQKAKNEGFRARSAYKLIQILQKYPILKVNGKFAQKILDLGCSPGSWVEVIIKEYHEFNEQVDGKFPPPQILGIDLTSVKPFLDYSPFTFVRMDIFKPECEQAITSWANGKIDVVLSDLAPKTAGNDADIGMQESMVVKVLEYAKNHLCVGGNLVIKIFQSENTQTIRNEWKVHFKEFSLYKPPASQPQSREMYFIGEKFLG
jgi:23S rRNA (uridine2552-2'-O)-methyltransferase